MKYILSLFILIGFSQTHASPFIYGPPVVVASTVTSSQFMAANSLRSYLIIQNTGTSNILVKFQSASVNTADGLLIPAGGAYEPIDAPTQAVFIRSVTGTNSAVIIQGN